MLKKVKGTCVPSVNRANKDLDEESAVGRNEQSSDTEGTENPSEESASGRNGEQSCVTEPSENLGEESAGSGSTSENLHVNQEMSSDLAERGKSPLARSIRTSDKDEQIELDEIQKSRQL